MLKFVIQVISKQTQAKFEQKQILEGIKLMYTTLTKS